LNKPIKYFEVQDWMGNTLYACDTLSEADEYKELIHGTEDDIYIIGFDEKGNEHAPQW